MKLFFIITLSVFLMSGSSQTLPEHKIIPEQIIQQPPEDTLEAVDFYCNILDELSLDREQWTTYLKKNLELDSISVDTIPAGSYTVLIHFAIDETGKVKDVIVLKDPGYCLGERVVEVVSNYRNSLKSSGKDHHGSISYHIQPITFLVEEEENCEELPKGLTL